MAASAAASVLYLTPSPLVTRAAQDGEETLFNMVIISAAPNMLDPAENWEGEGGFGILAHVYDGLFRFRGAETAEIVPVLAAEVPTVENGGISEDGLQYTVKLRPEATFSDGSPLTADAVVFSYERTRALKLGVDFLLDQIDTVEAVDPQTVRFTIKQPFSPFLNSLGSVFANQIVNPGRGRRARY